MIEVGLNMGLVKKITPFQQKVYAIVSRIPRGRVMTYQGIAKIIGCNSAQAVGQALKKNPFAPKVPCHRVIKSNLSVGGFFGKQSGKYVEKKIALLKKEGVLFLDGHLKDVCRVLSGKISQKTNYFGGKKSPK